MGTVTWCWVLFWNWLGGLHVPFKVVLRLVTFQHTAEGELDKQNSKDNSVTSSCIKCAYCTLFSIPPPPSTHTHKPPPFLQCFLCQGTGWAHPRWGARNILHYCVPLQLCALGRHWSGLENATWLIGYEPMIFQLAFCVTSMSLWLAHAKMPTLTNLPAQVMLRTTECPSFKLWSLVLLSTRVKLQLVRLSETQRTEYKNQIKTLQRSKVFMLDWKGNHHLIIQLLD